MRLRDSAGRWATEIDFGYCSHAQRFHVQVPSNVIEITVDTLDSDTPLWVLCDDKRLPDACPQFWTHTSQQERTSLFFDRLEQGCVTQFGWMGGCVLEAMDGLSRLDDAARWRRARERWLAHFMTGKHLHYQDSRGQSRVDEFRTIEAGLPIATIARGGIDHPVLDIAVEYLTQKAFDAPTCEGCYTLAYPLAQIAKLRGNADLLATAISALKLRHDKLFFANSIYLRHRASGRMYRDWSRGIAWYLLGWAETALLHGTECIGRGLVDHLHERSQWVIANQRENGLWPNFFDQPDLPPDTSGSAGIAAALLLLGAAGVTPLNEAELAASRCWKALQQFLCSDGWLSGVSPSNKRGEAEQRQAVRVSEAFGMGMMGRLASLMPTSSSIRADLAPRMEHSSRSHDSRF
jgi:hypothetical protein